MQGQTFVYQDNWPDFAAVQASVGQAGTPVTLWASPNELNTGAVVPIWQLRVDGRVIVSYQQTAPVFAASAEARRSEQLFAILYLLGVLLLVPVGMALYTHYRGDDATWQTELDGQVYHVALRQTARFGPLVKVDGQQVSAAQDPPWTRYQAPRERWLRFELGTHAAEIVEDQPLAGVRFVSYSLMVDRHRMPHQPIQQRRVRHGDGPSHCNGDCLGRSFRQLRLSAELLHLARGLLDRAASADSRLAPACGQSRH